MREASDRSFAKKLGSNTLQILVVLLQIAAVILACLVVERSILRQWKNDLQPFLSFRITHTRILTGILNTFAVSASYNVLRLWDEAQETPKPVSAQGMMTFSKLLFVLNCIAAFLLLVCPTSAFFTLDAKFMLYYAVFLLLLLVCYCFDAYGKEDKVNYWAGIIAKLAHAGLWVWLSSAYGTPAAVICFAAEAVYMAQFIFNIGTSDYQLELPNLPEGAQEQNIRERLKHGELKPCGMCFDSELREIVYVEPDKDAWKEGIRRGYHCNNDIVKRLQRIEGRIDDNKVELTFSKYSFRRAIVILVLNFLALNAAFTEPCLQFDQVFPPERPSIDASAFQALDGVVQDKCRNVLQVLLTNTSKSFTRVEMHCVLQGGPLHHGKIDDEVAACELEFGGQKAKEDIHVIWILMEKFFLTDRYPNRTVFAGSFPCDTYYSAIPKEKPLVVASVVAAKFVLLSNIFTKSPPQFKRLLLPISGVALIVAGMALWFRMTWAILLCMYGFWHCSLPTVTNSGALAASSLAQPFMRYFFGQDIFQISLLVSELSVFGLLRVAPDQNSLIVKTAARMNQDMLILVRWTHRFTSAFIRDVTKVEIFPENEDLLDRPSRHLELRDLMKWYKAASKVKVMTLHAIDDSLLVQESLHNEGENASVCSNEVTDDDLRSPLLQNEKDEEDSIVMRGFIIAFFVFVQLPSEILSRIYTGLALFSLVVIIMPITWPYAYVCLVLPLAAPHLEPFAGQLRKLLGLEEGSNKEIVKFGAFAITVCFVPPLLEAVFLMIQNFGELDKRDPQFYAKCFDVWYQAQLFPYRQLDLMTVYTYFTSKMSAPDFIALLMV